MEVSIDQYQSKLMDIMQSIETSNGSQGADSSKLSSALLLAASGNTSGTNRG